jgi:tetratricopeptide (TPR) repeat protein
MRLLPVRWFLCITLLAGVILSAANAALAQNCDPWAAQLVSAQGMIEIKRSGSDWGPAKPNDLYCPGDELRVGQNSRADVVLANRALIRLNQNSSLTFEGQKNDRVSLVHMVKGAAHFFSRKPSSLEVRTPYVVAGVRGTEFLIEADDQKAFVLIFEGSVLASNAAGDLVLASGQAATAEADSPPVLSVVARPRDAVQWALYYPPILYQRPPEAVSEKREAFQHALRAEELLEVGQADQAAAQIDQALRLDPAFAEAYGLKAVIAIVQNNKDQALAAANRAVELNPHSAAALLARSYVQQSMFQIEESRKSLEQAVQVEPNNALAWARLAEVHTMFGDLDMALNAARRAAEIDPNVATTQKALGFVYLMQVRTDEAKEAFQKAIRLDQADPLPRLGMGLAEIREGNLESGQRQIEIAASLDPNRSLVRSYLGKAFYEEKNTDLALREYAIAKQLDPLDPTPYFYGAIAKQTTNRPVEALHDYQKAIELNDNRAVYRSKLLLDSDEAARQSALARVYSELGFQEVALREGWKAVSSDPTNYSAHRFLSDSYAARPRHEIARVSELLQSQLLQPINITPIQPRLAESNLLLISALGPAASSFNEFNPLFNHNQVALQASGLVGGNDTYGFEGVLSGIYKKTSISSGYTHFETDGWRDNADQEDKLFNFFLQHEFTYKTNVQLEYRRRELEFGDIRLKFFDSSIFPAQRFTSERDTFRLGARHDISSNSTLITSIMYQQGEFRETHEPFPQPGVLYVDFNELDQKSIGGEIQHLHRSNRFNLVTGLGYFDVDNAVEQYLTFGPPLIPGPPVTPPSIDITDEFSLDLKHGNAYAYLHLNPIKKVTITLGASYDHADSNYLDRVKDQFNPKAGVVWTPFSGTTLRAALFRTLKRTLITQQTLEPTQVAGFNQFFDDEDLTETWQYGGAIDQKFSPSLYGGLEFTYRDLVVPYIRFSEDVKSNEEADWDEYIGRAYMLWTPKDWLALRTEYVYEHLRRDTELSEGVTDSDTHRIPLGINLFHPSGWSVNLTTTYINQRGDFGGFYTGDAIRRGSDSFWLVDTGVSYRFPKRYGSIMLGVTNLFDEDFNYFDSDLNNASIQPERTVFAKITLAF